ncbi:MAG TPA: nitrate ABC transporter ATP-binding protein, partial [Methylomirabilota bacterium]
LLDEPFSALDAQTRTLMMEELLSIWARTRQSILYVTHNIQEAVFMADRVIVLSRRPGEVLDTVPIRLSRPRGERQQGDPAFIQASDRIWGLIKSQAQAALFAGDARAERG